MIEKPNRFAPDPPPSADEQWVAMVRSEIMEARSRADRLLNPAPYRCEVCVLPKVCERLDGCLQSRYFAIDLTRG